MKTVKSLCIFGLLLAITTPVLADEAAEKVLADKDLTLKASLYLLSGDQEVAKDMGKLRKASANYEKTKREYRKDEEKINKAKAYIAQLQYRHDKLVKDNQGKSFTQKEYNKLMDAINQLKQEIENTTKQRAAKEEKMREEMNEAQGKYVEILMTLAEKADTVQAEYDELAKDDEVTAAIDKVSETNGRSYKLGPSGPFKAMYKMLDRLRGDIKAGVVELRPEGGVNLVDVRINGKGSRSMVLDTGASTVSLPYDFAQELGIEIGPEHETVRVQLADGKIVDAKRVMLESVQVGQFRVNDVEATVLPEDLIAATPLLGGSFLNHFTYKVEPEKGRLLLSRNEAEPAKEKK